MWNNLVRNSKVSSNPGSKVKIHVDYSKFIGNNLRRASMTLENLIEAYFYNNIYGYEKNRGNGRLDWRRVREIAADYDANGLGVITMADMEDGKFKLADAHHRLEAIMLKQGLSTSSNADKIKYLPFTKEQLQQYVDINICAKEDFLKTYTRLNAAKGHSTRASILNTDLGVGSMIKELLDMQQVESSVLEKFHNALTKSIYGHAGRLNVSSNLKEVTYAEVSLDRNIISKEVNLTIEDLDFALTNRQKETLVEAVDYVNATYKEYKKINNLSEKGNKLKLNQTSRAILTNAALYGFILWDKVSGRELITYLKPETLAMRITQKDAQIEKQAKKLINDADPKEVAEKVVAYLTTKKRL